MAHRVPLRSNAFVATRRDLLLLLQALSCAQLALAPLPSGAQTGTAHAARRIAVLTPERFDEVEAMFRRAMRGLGYIEGTTLVLEYWSADRELARLPQLAAEIVAARADVIIGVSPVAIMAAYRATKSIPIVMAHWGGDGLIQSGMVRSLSHPGGNVTGVNMLGDDMDFKRMQLLVEAVPRTRRVAALEQGVVRFSPQEVLQLTKAAGMAPRLFRVGEGSDRYERTFKALAAARVDALLVPSNPELFKDALQLFELAAKYRIPAIYEWSSMAQAGGLIGYGPNPEALQQRVAYFVDRILKGARPGDLPIEQPTTFELAVNLRTARALGLVIPQSVLVRADRVVE